MDNYRRLFINEGDNFRHNSTIFIILKVIRWSGQTAKFMSLHHGHCENKIWRDHLAQFVINWQPLYDHKLFQIGILAVRCLYERTWYSSCILIVWFLLSANFQGPVNWSRIKEFLNGRVIETVEAVDKYKGGSKAGFFQLYTFLYNRLSTYGKDRNDPTKDALSNLSPWFHFGKSDLWFRWHCTIAWEVRFILGSLYLLLGFMTEICLKHVLTDLEECEIYTKIILTQIGWCYVAPFWSIISN